MVWTVGTHRWHKTYGHGLHIEGTNEKGQDELVKAKLRPRVTEVL